MKKIKIYLDTCCLNRPFDDLTQNRVRLEAEAVVMIIRQVESGFLSLISSDVIKYEIEMIQDGYRKSMIEESQDLNSNFVRITAKIVESAQALMKYGIAEYDSLHLACASAGAAEIFLQSMIQF